MTDQQTLIVQFWKHEAVATRKVIARVPQAESHYRPDPRSRSAAELAWLIVSEEKMLIEGLEGGRIDWREDPPPATMDEVVKIYDARHDDIVVRMEKLPTASWEREVRFDVAGQTLRRAAGYDYGWEFLFDQVHHRGQLSTYLRPMGATVPSIYGPSADEMS